MAKLSHKVLRQKMLEHSLKQEVFAELLGISVRHVRNLCYRDIDISVSLCYRMSQILHTSMESLLVVPDRNTASVDEEKDLLGECVSYRQPLPITQLVVTSEYPHSGYFACPRCKVTLDREFVAYCDRCGQKLAWRHYKKAELIKK